MLDIMPIDVTIVSVLIDMTEYKFGGLFIRVHRHIKSKQIICQYSFIHHGIHQRFGSVFGHSWVCKTDNSIKLTAENVLICNYAERLRLNFQAIFVVGIAKSH
mmetsp:Transcript_39252/g.28387  ORF Transcript_39252/g.28387 Transcript_39252/m.28387 type:complete len:103 (-) Transcript_39252:518-826(-)